MTFINAVKLFTVEIDKIHCIVKFFIKKCTVIFVKQIALCNIQKKLKIPYKVLHFMIDSANICTLKNLTATTN